MRLIRTPRAQGHIEAPVRTGIAGSAGVPPATGSIGVPPVNQGSVFRVQGGAGILPAGAAACRHAGRRRGGCAGWFGADRLP